MKRLAIYYTPEESSSLAGEAAIWFGRDIYSTTRAAGAGANNLNDTFIANITKSPSHYGFHATLKPPFTIENADVIEEISLLLETFANSREAFIIPDFEVKMLNSFFCLRPKTVSNQLHSIANELVTQFDHFRLPAGQAELEKRRSSGLTRNQEQMLLKWGYPYVMEEYRFHLTLTGMIEKQFRQAVAQELSERFTSDILESVEFDRISLFLEDNCQPLHCIAHFPLKTSVVKSPLS